MPPSTPMPVHVHAWSGPSHGCCAAYGYVDTRHDMFSRHATETSADTKRCVSRMARTIAALPEQQPGGRRGYQQRAVVNGSVAILAITTAPAARYTRMAAETDTVTAYTAYILPVFRHHGCWRHAAGNGLPGIMKAVSGAVTGAPPNTLLK